MDFVFQQKGALIGGNVQLTAENMSVQKDICQGSNHKVPRPKSCNEATKHMHTSLVPRPHSAGDVDLLNSDLRVKDGDMVLLLEVS